MRTIKEDLEVPLTACERSWIRIPLGLLLAVVTFPLYVLSGILRGLHEFGMDFKDILCGLSV